MRTSAELDRLAMRARPNGSPIMEQNWGNLLFLHWPADPDSVRRLIPQEVEIDTFDGQAWIGITPFKLTGLRLASLPAMPGLDSFLEVNVRTYVHANGIPGIWFFSLDASKVIPAVAARMLFALPYHKAVMDFAENSPDFRFTSQRLGISTAEFEATWRTGVRLRDPDVESLAFFLVERYCYFASTSQGLTMTRIYHHPWILDEAVVSTWKSTMLGSLSLTEPDDPPLAHFSRSLNVQIWAPAPVS